MKTPAGRSITLFYEKNGLLNDPFRKKLVRIVGKELRAHRKKVDRPLRAYEKASYAKAICDLFPRLKNWRAECYYVSFSDPL